MNSSVGIESVPQGATFSSIVFGKGAHRGKRERGSATRHHGADELKESSGNEVEINERDDRKAQSIFYNLIGHSIKAACCVWQQVLVLSESSVDFAA